MAPIAIYMNANRSINRMTVGGEALIAVSTSWSFSTSTIYAMLLVVAFLLLLLCYLCSPGSKKHVNTCLIRLNKYLPKQRKKSNTTKSSCNDFCCQLVGHDSTDSLIQTGYNHKLEQRWREAGEAFESAAQQFVRKGRGGEHDAANNFAEAANCFRKLRQTEFTKKAVQCLQRAADMFAEQGHFSIAARHLEDAGDLARSAGADDSDLRFAIQLYLRAADTWSGEDSPANAAGSRTKAAELMADCGRLSEAAGLFEQLGESAQSHELLRFGAKELMLKSCLCLLCSGIPRVGEKARQLARTCDLFANSDELSLVTELSAAADAVDAVAFNTAVEKFGRFNNIDDFARRRLEQLRKRSSEEHIKITLR